MSKLFIALTILFTNGYLSTCNSQNSNLEPLNAKLQKIITLAEENIYNPALLQTEEWDNFIKYLQSPKARHLEGKDFVTAFNRESGKLPFSHFYIYDSSYKSKNQESPQAPFELEEISDETVILHVRKFIADATGMVEKVQEIAAKKYENLIIDLRDNSGGSLDAAVVLGRFLTANPIDAGTYVTRKWYTEHNRSPSKDEISNFPYLMDMSSDGFREIQKEKAFRMVLPGHNDPTFQGRVYVLQNTNTASACEPFAHLLKTQTNATLIGEKTAGQMLSADWFDVSESLSVFIPTNDFITAEGTRLDQKGVEPHFKVPSKDALKEALNKIDQENSK